MFNWFKSKNVIDPGDVFTTEEIDFYLMLVFTGTLTTRNLSPEYHNKITQLLERALYQGFGDFTTINFTSPEWNVLRSLRKSLYVFSAAKQYSQVRELSQLITPDIDFQTFKKKALEVFENYNKNYLKTEFNTAIGQAQSAKDYIKAQLQKEDFPLLQYRTQRDSRVRDEHAILDGITLPVDHPFWRYNSPKNGFNCRCYTIQLKKGLVTDLENKDLTDLNDKDKFPELFRMNPAIDGYIFDPAHHPYFKVQKGDAAWYKKDNFGLRSE